MERIIDRKITGICMIIPLIYFSGISLYSLLPEFFDIPRAYKVVFYWGNNTLFIFSFPFVLSYLVYDYSLRFLIRGTSIFLLILGLFQIIKSVGADISKEVWIGICPTYIIFLLIYFRYVVRKKVH